MKISMFELDNLSYEITVNLPDGTPKDLTGATVIARAKTGPYVIDLSGAVSEPVAGKLMVTAPSSTFDPRDYEIQVIVTQGGETRTFSDTLEVNRSIPPAA